MILFSFLHSSALLHRMQPMQLASAAPRFTPGVYPLADWLDTHLECPARVNIDVFIFRLPLMTHCMPNSDFTKLPVEFYFASLRVSRVESSFC